jgi:type I restriction enzyme S subunit
VPEHWGFERTKWRFRNRKELNTSGEHKNVLSLTLRGVVNNDPNNPEGLVPKDYRTYQFFAKGDLVFKLIDLENLRTSRVGLVHEDGIMSSAYVRLVPSGPVNVRYFFHQFYDLYARGVYNQLGAGVRSTLGASDLLNIDIVIPSPPEQAAIVRFVDWANGRLERAIRAKRKVIELLNEQKQAIIHRAVTRGLDPSVPLKPSGIPWLGDIPKHWQVISLRMRYSVELGKMLDAKRNTGRYSIPYLRNRDVQWDRVLTDDLPVMDIPPSEFPRYTVKRGDLLVCEGGQVGRSAFWEEQLPVCGFQKALHRVRSLDASRDFSRFFFYQMQLAAGRGVFSADGNENTFAHLTCDKLRRHRFAFPPFAEQKAIAEHIDGELRQFQIAIARLEREIELLREYRVRLGADVVTGKIDVREAAPQLPDEAPPDNTVDDADMGEEIEAAVDEAVA